MRLDGQFTVTALRPDVYAFLTDPATVSRHMPDVKNVVIDDADHFTVTARVGVSHIKGDVVMKLAIKDRQPPVSTTVVGKGTGLASAVDMVTSFTLESVAAGETEVNLEGRRDHLREAGGIWSSGPPGSHCPQERRHVHRGNPEGPAGLN